MSTTDVPAGAQLGSHKTVEMMLDCSSSTLRRIRLDPSLNFPRPVLTFGRPRFRLSEIERWINEQAQQCREAR